MAKRGGGARVGAGRKPARSRVVAFPTGAVVTVPADLTPEQRACWERWAPLAQSMGTLTDQTTPAFRLLCESHATYVRYMEVIRDDGETFFKVTVDGSGQEHRELKGHPLIGKAQSLAYRVEQLLARFSLAPTGRPIEQATKPESKWAAFGVGPA